MDIRDGVDLQWIYEYLGDFVVGRLLFPIVYHWVGIAPNNYEFLPDQDDSSDYFISFYCCDTVADVCVRVFLTYMNEQL